MFVDTIKTVTIKRQKYTAENNLRLQIISETFLRSVGYTSCFLYSIWNKYWTSRYAHVYSIEWILKERTLCKPHIQFMTQLQIKNNVSGVKLISFPAIHLNLFDFDFSHNFAHNYYTRNRKFVIYFYRNLND